MLPHVFYTVEELAAVQSLEKWTNLNVQFIGKIVSKDGVTMCRSVGEGMEKFEILVDFSLVAQEPVMKRIVRICGELEMIDRKPRVKAKIIRNAELLDIMLYHRAMEIRNRYTPHFVLDKNRADGGSVYY